MIVENFPHRHLVADTDDGKLIQEQIADLKELLYAYRQGIIRESSKYF